MITCPVCDGTGFMRAAPLSCLLTGRYVGARKALWRSAVAVPCWACTGSKANDIATAGMKDKK